MKKTLTKKALVISSIFVSAFFSWGAYASEIEKKDDCDSDFFQYYQDLTKTGNAAKFSIAGDMVQAGVQLKISAGTPAEGVDLMLEHDSGGIPDDTVIDSCNIPSSEIDSTMSWHYCAMTDTILSTDWLVVKPHVYDGTNKYTMADKTGAGTVDKFLSTDATWVNIAGAVGDHWCFETDASDATPTPSPSASSTAFTDCSTDTVSTTAVEVHCFRKSVWDIWTLTFFFLTLCGIAGFIIKFGA